MPIDEQRERIESRLDELVSIVRETKEDMREVRNDLAFLKANQHLVAQQVVTNAKTIADHGSRISALESTETREHGHTRSLSESFTNEVTEMVGNSIRVAAPDIAQATMRGAAIRNISAGLVLALAILATILLSHH
jgi:chromosome segregation ATPase